MLESLIYPFHLVPQPAYCWLNNRHLTEGILLRRTSRPGVIDAAGKLLPDQLSSPNYPEDLARHFSVNLLGNFQIADAAWVISKGEAKDELTSKWNPGEPGMLPTADQARCLST
ncbi:MAG: hypothetical protein EOO61_09530, partial [Hymenobacter sp.]